MSDDFLLFRVYFACKAFKMENGCPAPIGIFYRLEKKIQGGLNRYLSDNALSMHKKIPADR